MRPIKTLMLLSVFLVTTGRAVGQTYSLEDCISAALNNNQQLQNSRLDMEAATYRIKEVKSALLPTIDVGGQLMYYSKLPSQYAPASAFGGPEGQYTKLTLTMPQTTSANVQLTQNLYNQSVLIGLKAAKVTQEVADLQETVTRENIIYSVTSTYYSIQVLDDNLSRLHDNIVNLEKTSKVNEVLKNNEIVSDNVHNRLLINLENLHNQYENQKLLLDQHTSLLKYLMNVEISEPILIEKFQYNETSESPAYEDVMQRPDLLLQQAQLKIAEYDRKSVLAGYYPTLTNTVTFGYTGYYDDLSPFKQINNDWINSSSFNLSLKIPVFDGFRKRNQLRQKEIAIQKNVNTLSLMKSNADKEVHDALKNYLTNQNLFISTKKSLTLAERVFNSSQREYESGITSITDFLDAQNDLSTARTNFSTALLNLTLSELSLKKANGSLLKNL